MGITRKKAVIFISDPGSEETLWHPLVKNMQSDDAKRDLYQCLLYVPPPSDQTSLETQTLKFEEWYSTKDQQAIFSKADIIFVGHSLGGVIVQSFIIRKLKLGKSKDFYNVKQILLVAPPNLGYASLSRHEKWQRKFKKKTDFERITKTWNDEISDLYQAFMEFMVDADEFSNYHRPISTTLFYAQSDEFIQSKKSLGTYPSDSIHTVEGGHYSVLQALSKEKYEEWAKCLEHPTPHKGIFMVDILETFIKVEPLNDEAIKVNHGNQERVVKTNNRGWIKRRIQFSQQNICERLFSIRYGIENGEGYIRT